MNNVQIVGRIVRDPEVKYTAGENASAMTRFTVAVNRPYKNSDGNYEADFIPCVSWRQQAEFVSKYFHKGDMIGLIGNIRTGNYFNKDGQKVYTTEVYVDRPEFVGGKNNANVNASATPSPERTVPQNNDWMNVPDVRQDEELPY